MSRQDLSSLCWNLCRDIEKVCRDLVYQFSTYLCVSTLRFLSQHRNISSSEVCRNIGFFYCDQVSSLSKHHMSRPCLSITTIISSSFDIAIYITLLQHILLLSVLRHTLPCRGKGLSLKPFFCLNKLFHIAIISVVTEDPLSRQNFCFLPASFVATGASLSRQILLCVDILLKNLVAT